MSRTGTQESFKVIVMPETNVILKVNYTGIKNKERWFLFSVVHSQSVRIVGEFSGTAAGTAYPGSSNTE